MAQTLDIVQRTAVNAVREKEMVLRERDALVREIAMLKGVRIGTAHPSGLLFLFELST